MLPANFHLKSRDGLARIGEFDTNHGKVVTPTLMPVIDPINPNIISIPDMKKMGANIIITNAYLLYRKESIRDLALEKGIHEYLAYDGPIMTDSGAFQLMTYGSVDVSNREITKFQEDINVDIGVFLDIPVAHGSQNELKIAVEETIERAKEHIDTRNPGKTVQWVGPLQGGKNFEAFEHCSNFMKNQPFEIHAIGSVVPLMENYDYLSVIKLIELTKKIIPSNRPIHLFGAGHPMLFALACYLGVDLFDSAAYVLFAKNGRYITTFGTYLLKDLEFFPCSCKFCAETNPNEVLKWDSKTQVKFLANHNLTISFEELNLVRQAIKDGRLFNLVLQRSMAHPRLAEAVHYLTNISVSDFLERYVSLSYSKARFFSHPWSLSDPIVTRHKQRILTRLKPLRKIALIKPKNYQLPPDLSTQNLSVDPIFGIVPEEWKHIYPLLQNESFIKTDSVMDISFITQFLSKYRKNFDNIFSIGFNVEEKIENPCTLEELPRGNPITPDEMIKSTLNYQFGIFSTDTLPKFSFEYSKKTKRLKNFSSVDGNPWGVIRAHDNLIIPQSELIKWLHKTLNFPKYRVVVEKDAVQFVLEGRSVFCKFVQDIDDELRIGDEVLIVDIKDELLGSGTLNYSPEEVKSFSKGIAVKTRKRKNLK
ncbi:MAG: tRNA guanosine(15) transglycosylase TgtA [Candidatus Hodarchaeales archaeon]|jgi:7-cyano-7-deazaguanine tRNA-ribosyltransferase